MKDKLTIKEMKEPMFVTWGRIRGLSAINKDRLNELIMKFDQDLLKAKVEENYFKNIPGSQIDALSTESKD